MQVLSIVTKLTKSTLTDKMENRKDEMWYTGFGLNKLSVNINKFMVNKYEKTNQNYT